METTTDGFLGGRLNIRQPKQGFRSGADAVLLAAAVPAKSGQSVLELGLGVGVASLCLGWRVSGLQQTGLEIQAEYAELARQNAAENGMDLEVIEGDITDPPKAVTDKVFDHVFLNPPYYRSGAWTETRSGDRNTALGETGNLEAWIDLATRRTKPGGYVTVIQKAGRFIDVIAAADHRLGGLEIKPIAARAGRSAELVILRFRKGGRAAPVLNAPLIMHEGENHRQDTAHPSERSQSILRHGKNLEF